MTLPNFLVVGAAKAGTTSLYAHLGQHPDVFMTALKEPRFFAYEGEEPQSFAGPGSERLITSIVRTRGEYEALFVQAQGESAIGESSPAYLYSPVAARRIQEVIPHAKIVAVLRDPAERAHSHWVDNVGSGWEPVRDFTAALDLAEERRRANWWRKWDYIGHGFYGEQLRRYFRVFPREQIRVFLFEDLVNGWESRRAELLEFLEVDPLLGPRALGRENRGAVPRFELVDRLLSRSNPVRTVLRHGMPPRMREAIRRQVSKTNTQTPALAPQLRLRLQAMYREDVLGLEELIDRDLSAWLAPPEAGRGLG